MSWAVISIVVVCPVGATWMAELARCSSHPWAAALAPSTADSPTTDSTKERRPGGAVELGSGWVAGLRVAFATTPSVLVPPPASLSCPDASASDLRIVEAPLSGCGVARALAAAIPRSLSNGMAVRTMAIIAGRNPARPIPAVTIPTSCTARPRASTQMSRPVLVSTARVAPNACILALVARTTDGPPPMTMGMR